MPTLSNIGRKITGSETYKNVRNVIDPTYIKGFNDNTPIFKGSQNVPKSNPAPIKNPIQSPTPVPSIAPAEKKMVAVAMAADKPVVPGNRGMIPQTNTMKVAPEVDQAITGASKKFNVPKELLYDIAFSESSLDPRKTNPGAGAINPVGLYQFTDATWNNEVMKYAKDPKSSLFGVLSSNDRNDPAANAMAAAYLIKFGQLGKWDASEWNWGNYHPVNELDTAGFYNQSQYHKPGVRPSVRLSAK